MMRARLSTLLCMSIFLSLGSTSRISGLIKSAPDDHDKVNLPRTYGSDPLSWLKGHLYRVGPALFDYGGRSVSNVIDGLAKVHGWRFSGDGSVVYTASMVRSRVYNRTMQEKRITAFSMMSKPTPQFNIGERIAMAVGGPDYSDNTNIAVWDLDKEHSITLTTESFNLHQVAPDTLTYNNPYKLPVDFGKMGLFSASHFSHRPSASDGSSFNYIMEMHWNFWHARMDASYEFFQYTPTAAGRVSKRKVGSIPVSLDDIRIIHAFEITENYLVIPRWNYKFDFAFDLSIVEKLAYMCKAFVFEYNKPTYVDIINIKTGGRVQFDLGIPYRAIHGMNSFERRTSGGQLEIVMDFPTTTDPQAMDLNKHCLFDIFKISILTDPEYLYNNIPWDTTLRRFVFNMDTGNWYSEDFPKAWKPTDCQVEFPFMNPNYRGKEYCYAYFQQWNFKTEDMDLLKYDTCKKTATTWHLDNKHVLEPVFVPRPGGTAEDDGAIVAQVYDSSTGQSELCVWDAKDLSLLARYDNKVAVPYTVHGDWFDE